MKDSFSGVHYSFLPYSNTLPLTGAGKRGLYAHRGAGNVFIEVPRHELWLGEEGVSMKDSNLIIAVDEEDRFLEERDKWECHQSEGILHRAFLVMVYNDRGEILLARRSPGKKLWPGFWDGTVASHVQLGESYEDSARRRLDEELGLNDLQVNYVTKFIYHAQYQDVGSERETYAVLKACADTSTHIMPCAQEITDIRYVPPDAVLHEEGLTPWLLIALEKIPPIPAC